jgi:hypothetical protein
MHTKLAVSVIVGLILAVGRARADDAADAKKLVDRAIEAIGGEEKLAPHAAQTFSESGTYYGMGSGLPYTGNYAVQWPDKFKMEIEGIFTIVINGDTGFTVMGGVATDMSEQELAHQQQQHYVGWVASLTCLDDEGFTLATAGEANVESQPASGVKVSHEGRPDVTLWFDKQTGRLVKTEYRGTSSEKGYQEVLHETFYSDFKDFAGVQLATKMLMKVDGERYIETQIQKLEAVGKLDPSVFAKP